MWYYKTAVFCTVYREICLYGMYLWHAEEKYTDIVYLCSTIWWEDPVILRDYIFNYIQIMNIEISVSSSGYLINCD